MSYKKQNFTDGQILTAAQLNHIEDGVGLAVLYAYQELTEEQKAQVRANIGAAAVSEGGIAPARVE